MPIAQGPGITDPSLKSLQAFDSATWQIERHDKTDILTVPSVPGFVTQWLMPQRFSAQHGSICIRLDASTDPADPAARLVNADIRYGSVLPSRRVITQSLLDEALMPLCSPDFPDGRVAANGWCR